MRTSSFLASFVVTALIGLAILEPPSSLAAGGGQSSAYTSFWGGDFVTYSDFNCEHYYVTVTSWANVQTLADDGVVSSYVETGGSAAAASVVRWRTQPLR